MTKVISEFIGTNRFLSNFYLHPVTFRGVEYPTAEHAFQAAKTFDRNAQREIREAKTPAQAKRLGRGVVLRDDWESIKLAVMEQIIRAKFQDSKLLKRLLRTGDAIIIEGNWWGDRFWGACASPPYHGDRIMETWPEDHKWETAVRNWYGRNELGKILMKIREEFKVGQP